jgi:hypothetical protein
VQFGMQFVIVTCQRSSLDSSTDHKVVYNASERQNYATLAPSFLLPIDGRFAGSLYLL